MQQKKRTTKKKKTDLDSINSEIRASVTRELQGDAPEDRPSHARILASAFRRFPQAEDIIEDVLKSLGSESVAPAQAKPDIPKYGQLLFAIRDKWTAVDWEVFFKSVGSLYNCFDSISKQEFPLEVNTISFSSPGSIVLAGSWKALQSIGTLFKSIQESEAREFEKEAKRADAISKTLANVQTVQQLRENGTISEYEAEQIVRNSLDAVQAIQELMKLKQITDVIPTLDSESEIIQLNLSRPAKPRK